MGAVEEPWFPYGNQLKTMPFSSFRYLCGYLRFLYRNLLIAKGGLFGVGSAGVRLVFG
jgi:hypothetical protein